jgi:hypothetical protein
VIGLYRVICLDDIAEVMEATLEPTCDPAEARGCALTTP